MYDHVVELRSHVTELQSHCCTTVRFTSTVVDIHGIKNLLCPPILHMNFCNTPEISFYVTSQSCIMVTITKEMITN